MADVFDPYAILAALERHHVSYVVIGGLGRVLRGADELTDGIDIAPSLRQENLRRLERALEELHASPIEGGELFVATMTSSPAPVIDLVTRAGTLKIVPEPPGTRRGYDDLRRAATREPIGKGLRPSVASVGDLARMLAALGREEDQPRLRALRRLAELERRLTPEL
jgi:hypothetical protein